MAKRQRRQTRSAPACGQCAYRVVTDSHPDGLLVIDREGAVRLSNPAASEMLGVRLRSGLSVRDQAREHAVLREFPRAPNGTRVIRRWSFLVSAYRGLWASFHRPRQAALVQEAPAEEPLILPDPSPDRVTPDALHDLDQVLERLRRAEPPPKADA